jgi:protease IV
MASFPGSAGAQPAQVVIQQRSGGRFVGRFFAWLVLMLLMGSIALNLSMYAQYHEYFASAEGPIEKYHSGDKLADDKIALIKIEGTIMPPFTDRVLKSIRQAKEDDSVKGVLLAVDSPGGLVSDSHQIYHRLKELAEKKPIVVSMGSMAASGGYYVAMGAGENGKIYAEPTTWTGSIGVIIPHYEVTGLAEKAGVKASPLKTGEFKDALSPFRELTDREKALWDDIMNQSFERFLDVIETNRKPLDKDQVRKLATGQIYTAQDARTNGLIDEIGYEEDAIDELKRVTSLQQARVVVYQHPVSSVLDLLLGAAEKPDAHSAWQTLLDASVPRAMYFCSWGLPLPMRAGSGE